MADMNSTYTNSNGTTYTYTCGTENGPLRQSFYWPNLSRHLAGRVWANVEEAFTTAATSGTVAEMVADLDCDSDVITVAIETPDQDDEHALWLDVWYLARVD